MESPRIIALRDISKEIRNEHKKLDKYLDWNNVFSPFKLDNKETRNMNRVLGIWGVNKGVHNMNRK